MELSREELRTMAQRSVGDSSPREEKQVSLTAGKCLEPGLGGSPKKLIPEAAWMTNWNLSVTR